MVYIAQYPQQNFMAHYGVKGMKWGIRRYQYNNGSYTPLGYRRRNDDGTTKSTSTKSTSTKSTSTKSTSTKSTSTKSTSTKSTSTAIKSGVKKATSIANEKVKLAKTMATGKQYVDTYINSNVSLSRIQTNKTMEDYPFYATYKNKDINKYMGLFGSNLRTRADREARQAEKKVKKSKDEIDIQRAKELREYSDNMKVYQLDIRTNKKLKIPSDDNATNITLDLIKRDKDFKNDLRESLIDSKSKMRRPQQQILFNNALKSIDKDFSTLTRKDKIDIYKAFNLSLTNHNDYEVRAQNKFYNELSKNGYHALLDYNDKEFSSYHAKRPVIVFDNTAVKLQSVSETNPKVVDKLYKKYNRERITKEAIDNTVGLIGKYGNKTINDSNRYISNRYREYLDYKDYK